MDNVIAVSRSDSPNDAKRIIKYFAPRQPILNRSQALSAYEFRYDIRSSGNLANAVDSGNIGMMNACRGPRFIQEGLSTCRLMRRKIDESDGHRTVKQGVAACVQPAFATCA